MALTPAERQLKRRQSKAKSGLVKVEVWVPAEAADQIRKLERKLCAGVRDE